MNHFRRFPFRWLTWLWLLVAGLIAGCSTSAPPPITPVPTGAGVELSADTLRPGDRIRIVYNDIPDPPTPVEQVIPQDGKLLLPRGYEIEVAGKKRTEVEREIAAIYIDKLIYKKISVTIERMASFVYVGGDVRASGPILYRSDLTVVAAIDAAGGFTEFADRRDVILTRGGTGQQIHVNVKKAVRDPKLNLPLYPGDSIHVPRSWL